MLIEKLSAISLDITATIEQELPKGLFEGSPDELPVEGRAVKHHTAKGGAKHLNKSNTAMKEEDSNSMDDPVKEEFDTPSTTSYGDARKFPVKSGPADVKDFQIL